MQMAEYVPQQQKKKKRKRNHALENIPCFL